HPLPILLLPLSLPFVFLSLCSSSGGRIWSDGGGEGRSGSGDGGTASNSSCTAASSSAGAATHPGFMYGRIPIALARQIRERYTRPGAIAESIDHKNKLATGGAARGGGGGGIFVGATTGGRVQCAAHGVGVDTDRMVADCGSYCMQGQELGARTAAGVSGARRSGGVRRRAAAAAPALAPPPPLRPSPPTPLQILSLRAETAKFLGRKRNREKDREGGAVGPTYRWASQICFCVND
uniref:Uncharacterized protein n=1 Tax=Oryza glaberrima TaxID=4538 RepID=I1P7U1_ORYGL